MSELTDQECRAVLAVSLAEYNEWLAKATANGWKLPGGSTLPAHSWVHYWKLCEAHQRNPKNGRPVVPHRC